MSLVVRLFMMMRRVKVELAAPGIRTRYADPESDFLLWKHQCRRYLHMQSRLRVALVDGDAQAPAGVDIKQRLASGNVAEGVRESHGIGPAGNREMNLVAQAIAKLCELAGLDI